MAESEKKAGSKAKESGWKPRSFRISPGLWRAINLYMASHGMRDRSELVREAIAEFIKYVPTKEDLEYELARLEDEGAPKK